MKRLTNFFLSGFDNAPHFERLKAAYLFYILLTSLGFVVLVFGGQILFESDKFYIIGNCIGLTGVIVAFYLFKQKKIELSGHVLACSALSMIIIHNIVRDMFVFDLAMRYRIYINMVALFGTYLIVISFFREKTMVWFYGAIFEVIILFHSFVIYEKLKAIPVINKFVIQHTITAFTGIAVAGIISTWLLGYMEALFQQSVEDAAKIKSQNSTLEKLVDRRTKALKVSNHNLQEFAYIVSHDLKEPLRTISGFIALLRKDLQRQNQSSAQTEEYMDYVLRGTQQMEELISDILTYSQLNVTERKFDAVSLQDVVTESMRNLKRAIEESSAKLDIAELPEISGDKRLLIQLFQNLISNALKYKKDEQPANVRITAKERGDFIVVTVEDNGIGIPEKYFDTVFQAFKRLHSKVKYEGTGIGLAICKKIVELHGGEIRLESEEGIGSTFILTFPKTKSVAALS